jgi:hypothetical protein
MHEHTNYLTEQQLTGGTELDRRLFLTRELYVAMEHVSEGRPALFHIYDMVPSMVEDANGQKEAVRISVRLEFDEAEQRYRFQVELPQAGNEVAIFLHANQLYQFLRTKLSLENIDVEYVPKQESGFAEIHAEEAHQIHLPLTIRPSTKNYDIIGRDGQKQPGVSVTELADAHRAWLDELYGDTPGEFPQIDVLVYSKKNGVQPNEVQFRRTIDGQTELGEYDVDSAEARKLWQTFSLPTLQVLTSSYNYAL